MTQSHDLYYKPHHLWSIPLSIPTSRTCTGNNNIERHYDENHVVYNERGSSDYRFKIKGTEMNTEGKNEDFEMNKIQEQV